MSKTTHGGENELHQRIAVILAAREQHYTAARRMIVDALASSGRPTTINELLCATQGLAASTAYRNLTVLSEAGLGHVGQASEGRVG